VGDPLAPLEFADILSNHAQISKTILGGLKNNLRILPLFQHYLRQGYYPFFLEGEQDYLPKIANSLSKIFYEDIMSSYRLDITAIKIMQKITYMVATSAPFSPNISTLASDLGISRDTVYQYLEYLKDAGVLFFLFRNAQGRRMARKPEKIYLANPNLFFTIVSQQSLSPANQGAVREAFLVDQLSHLLRLSAPESGDLLINERILLEAGGKSKTRKQIANIEDSYVVRDNVEYGVGREIPIWLFGFLY